MSEEVQTTRNRKWSRRAGIALLVIAGLLAYYLIVAYAGWQSGQKLLIEQQQQQLDDEVNKQLGLAQEDVRNGRYALAEKRLQWILTYQPQNGSATTLLPEVQAQLALLLTPVPAVTPTPLPTATPIPIPTITPTPIPIENPDKEFNNIQNLVAEEQWEEALPIILSLQRAFPSYERLQTDRLLYDSYIGLGVKLLEGDEVEQGLFYIGQAERLGDLSEEVLALQTAGELFVAGMTFYGINWEASAYNFRELCFIAPFYQDSCSLLQEVLLSSAEQYAISGDWCTAYDRYEEASTHGIVQGLPDKLEEAETACLASNPVGITGTLPITQPRIITP